MKVVFICDYSTVCEELRRLSCYFQDVQARGPVNTQGFSLEPQEAAPPAATQADFRDLEGTSCGGGMGADSAAIDTWRETDRRGLIAGTPPRLLNR